MDAPDAFGVFQASLELDALRAGGKDAIGPEASPAPSCDAVMERAKGSLDDPQTSGYKVMARYCGNAGMAFTKEIRCERGQFPGAVQVTARVAQGKTTDHALTWVAAATSGFSGQPDPDENRSNAVPALQAGRDRVTLCVRSRPSRYTQA